MDRKSMTSRLESVEKSMSECGDKIGRYETEKEYLDYTKMHIGFWENEHTEYEHYSNLERIMFFLQDKLNKESDSYNENLKELTRLTNEYFEIKQKIHDFDIKQEQEEYKENTRIFFEKLAVQTG